MKGLAIASLILGIIGFLFSFAFGLGLLPSILAIILGLIPLIKKVEKAMAITGLVLGILGATISYCWIELAKHPEEIWRIGEERLKKYKDKKTFLDQYSEEVKTKAAKNANIPKMLLLTNPERCMDLIIEELKKHPERYPTKDKENKIIKKK